MHFKVKKILVPFHGTKKFLLLFYLGLIKITSVNPINVTKKNGRLRSWTFTRKKKLCPVTEQVSINRDFFENFSVNCKNINNVLSKKFKNNN
jgi:hypothetical protein